ncbi:hypothetical protein [Vibrio phage VpKK5]|uniref:hypothetical protein n=1 Tax=Vibrio phage VpKK5 TaxID=1538804 RepID=UPI0004F7B7A5|nr:hypothetical protein VC55_gp70 [Vibrio phage VpKK5]AIM40573.1 hypothetical protein [Vibrio phage VpKK5]
MMKNSYESDTVVISFADVQYVEKAKCGGAWIVMAGTTWDSEQDCYNNAAWLSSPETQPFIDQYNAFLDSRNGVIITGVMDTIGTSEQLDTDRKLQKPVFVDTIGAR